MLIVGTSQDGKKNILMTMTFAVMENRYQNASVANGNCGTDTDNPASNGLYHNERNVKIPGNFQQEVKKCE